MVTPQAWCAICGRSLDIADDPLSLDCGGDCWGCVGWAELGGDLNPKVLAEIEAGLRNANGSPADR